MKLWIIATAIVVSFAAAPLASAGKCACEKGHAKMWKKLGVTDEVKAKVKDLHKAHYAAKKDAKVALKAKKAELHTLLTAETLDQAKIDAAIGELVTLKGAATKAKLEHKSKIAALLTGEQRGKLLKAMGGKKHKKHGKKCGCGK